MNEDTLTALRAADPVRRIEIEGLRADPVFGDLAEAIVAGDFEVKGELLNPMTSFRGRAQPDRVLTERSGHV